MLYATSCFFIVLGDFCSYITYVFIEFIQKYNLRPGKKKAVLPVQLQLCDDQDFMPQVLQDSQPTPAQWQVYSDISTSSDLDRSDLIHSSDSKANASHTEHRSYDKFMHENQMPDSRDADTTQQLVNQTIFRHLNKIGLGLIVSRRMVAKKLVDDTKIKNKKLKENADL